MGVTWIERTVGCSWLLGWWWGVLDSTPVVVPCSQSLGARGRPRPGTERQRWLTLAGAGAGVGEPATWLLGEEASPEPPPLVPRPPSGRQALSAWLLRVFGEECGPHCLLQPRGGS